MASPSVSCPHSKLQVTVSPHAAEAGYSRRTPSQLAAAATPSGRAPGSSRTQAILLNDDDDGGSAADFAACCPAPLVLPDDALAVEPDSDGQSLRSWIQEKARNAVTERRKTIYVASAPEISDEVFIMSRWTEPLGKSRRHKVAVKPLEPEHVTDYLAAFYHGLPVKPYPGSTFRFVPWEERQTKNKKPATVPEYVGLAIGTSVTRIRARPPPDKKFTRQLNLTDILDALIANLPGDAYSVLLLVDHDLYEDDDDDFCCGRAYGGSRVSVVSSARYRPELDDYSGIDLGHMWPASHCASYVEEMCGVPKAKGKAKAKASPATKGGEDADPRMKPLRAAVEAARLAPPAEDDLYALWLSRFVRTASHELGHCLALGHCVYYACVMQSTTGMAEDVRQPPYLCPVDMKKVTRAVLDVNKRLSEDEYLAQRDMALFNFCGRWKQNAMFAGYQAWLGCFLGQK
ncbi:hypothetical protein GE09DRAFT_253384 [Coniochaeta sp. 2T2.1]|nr:hypothetical protein GE09DRAFT_253384 [Coniochaeta sp. 2T2.1]